MDEHEQAPQSGDGETPDEFGEGARQAPEPQQDPVESGALEREQQGKGYGEDEGERGGALPDE